MSQRKRTTVSVSPWTVVLLAIFIAAASPVVLASLLLAAVCHEMSHYLTLRCFGAQVEAVRVGIFGAEICVADRPTLSYGREMLAVAAGPAANIALALLLSWGGQWQDKLYVFAGAQLILGAFNLLPVRPLDGGTMIWLALSWGIDPFAADRWLGWIGAITTAALVVLSLWLCSETGSPFLLLGVIGLGKSVWSEKKLVKRGKRR